MYGSGWCTVWKGQWQEPSLVKRSVIKISRHRESGRKREVGINTCRQWTLCFCPASIDVSSQLQPERAEKKGQRCVCSDMCERGAQHLFIYCKCLMWISANSPCTSASEICFPNNPNKTHLWAARQRQTLLFQDFQSLPQPFIYHHN